jgi:hypothetical protein
MTEVEGTKTAHHLMTQLEVKEADLVQGAYMDLLETVMPLIGSE